MTTPTLPDHVEREIVIRAPIERAFAALTDPSLYPTWGPVAVDGALVPGERPLLDFGIGGKCRIYVVALDAPRYFAYRWIQGVFDPEVLVGDPLEGPNTLVEFHLDEVDGGTRVRVVESGLRALPGLLDDDKALDNMREGWRLMLGGLDRFIAAGDVTFADRIENTVVVGAPPDRIHAALVHPVPWWAQAVDGAFAPGAQPVLDFGQFGKTRVAVLEVAPHRVAFRWVHGVDDPARRIADPGAEASTVVEITLTATPEGTRIDQVEHGFAALPAGEAQARFRSSFQGWGIILGLLQHHLEQA